MRVLLWLIAALLFLGSAAIAYFLLKGKTTSIAAPKPNLSDLVNVAIFFVAVVSLWVAVATDVDASATAKEQQKILDASRMALESVVLTAQGQQTLLEQNLETSKTQLALVQEQWKQEQERQSRRAQLSIMSLNGVPWATVEQANGNVQVNVSPGGKTTLRFVLRNTGAASLVHPIYVLTATPETVLVDQADFPIARANHNRFQLSGPAVLDFLPYSASNTDQDFSVDVTVPDIVLNFDLAFKVLGENMDGAKEYTLHLMAHRQQQ
jgi:hypothetical protein